MVYRHLRIFTTITALYMDDNSPNVPNELTIREAQQLVDNWIRTTGVRYFSELTNMAILTEEVGEVARLMSRLYGDQSFKPSDTGKELADELADTLWVLLCIANQTGMADSSLLHAEGLPAGARAQLQCHKAVRMRDSLHASERFPTTKQIASPRALCCAAWNLKTSS